MTPPVGSLDRPDDEQRAALERTVDTWARRVAGVSPSPGGVEVVEVAVLHEGRPGLVDVVARVDGRMAHVVLGLRRTGDALHLLGTLEDPVVGLVEDEHGLAVVVDAVHDADTARLLFGAVGVDRIDGAVGLAREGTLPPEPAPRVSVVEDAHDPMLVGGERCILRVFSWLHQGPHPGLTLLLALDDAGFNHLPAPMAVWRRGDRDLGMAQELHVGAAPGWAVALGSLRDLCARGGAPEAAGGDFAPEARALGTMVARMHLALDRAYGRRAVAVADWVEEAESVVARVDAAALDGEDIARALRSLRTSGQRAPAVRVHGDLHLGRTSRTDQGWILVDCTPGGVCPPGDEPGVRSPLADVADVLWSLHHAATSVAWQLSRDPVGHPTAAEAAGAWEARNRRAFVAGYLSTSGIGTLVPQDRGTVSDLVALFELERDARVAQRRHPSAAGRGDGPRPAV